MCMEIRAPQSAGHVHEAALHVHEAALTQRPRREPVDVRFEQRAATDIVPGERVCDARVNEPLRR